MVVECTIEGIYNTIEAKSGEYLDIYCDVQNIENITLLDAGFNIGVSIELYVLL